MTLLILISLYTDHHSFLQCVTLSPFALLRRVKISYLRSCRLQISIWRQFCFSQYSLIYITAKGCGFLQLTDNLSWVMGCIWLFLLQVSLSGICAPLDFYLNKSRSYTILQRSSNPRTSGLGVGLAVIAIYKQCFGGEWDCFLPGRSG